MTTIPATPTDDASTAEASEIEATDTGTTSTVDVADDPAYGYRYVRYSTDDAQRNRYQARSVQLWDHASPDSVLIVPIANHWSPGSWQAVLDMAHTYKQTGADVAVQEVMDRCFAPYDTLGAMRNEAIMKSMEGWDWLMMVDNDVYPQPDTLIRLVSRGFPIIAPYVVEPGTGKPLHGPHRNQYSGCQPVRWCVLSMLLFRVNVWNVTGPEFWNSGIGADEGYHFQKLWHYGHNPVIDTEVSVRVANAPTYPLASLRWNKTDYTAFWERRQKHLLARPDRAPVNPDDRRVNQYGEYLPFIDPNEANATPPEAQVSGPDGGVVPAKAKRPAPANEGSETDDAKPDAMGALFDPARLAGLTKLADPVGAKIDYPTGETPNDAVTGTLGGVLNVTGSFVDLTNTSGDAYDAHDD